MNEPFFSIIIPVYNTEKYLPRCFDSFLAQSFDCKKIEMVVINDGSPNVAQCDEIISSYKEKLNINYIRLEKNSGTHIARKHAVENAKGKYLLFIDPDDYLVNTALQILYNDIHINGNTDYIWFLFSILYEDGRRETMGCIKDIDTPSLLEDMLNFKVSHNVTNRCFNATFAKKAWSKMPCFYACYHEDYYEMLILHHYAKTKRIIRKPLYVYEQGLGITEATKYTKEKLKKIILSIYNVNEYLTTFYKQENCLSYLSLVQKCSDRVYTDWMLNSSFKEFMGAIKEIMRDEVITEDVIASKYIARLNEEIAKYKRREKWLFPIIICCALIHRAPKRDKAKCPKSVLDATDKILKDKTNKAEYLEYVYLLEGQFLFYKERAKCYDFVKRSLSPLWHFYKRLFKR